MDDTKINEFIDNFSDYLLSSEKDCDDSERGNIEACVYGEVFQIFGRIVKKHFGINIFSNEVK